MKVVSKPIEVIAKHDLKGNITPLRFRIEENEEFKVINVNKVIDRSSEKIAESDALIFNCQNIINGTEKRYELCYEIKTCRWILFKI